MKRILQGLTLVVLLLLAWSAAHNAGQAAPVHSQTSEIQEICDMEPPDGYEQQITGIVDGDELELVVSARFGGAVESLTWRGKEFINIFDHGRQISYAWHFDDYGECLNPTEPGSADDVQALTSTSELLSVCRGAENRLTTTTQPAYWLSPGQTGYCSGGVDVALNETLVSDQILEKTIEIGYRGIDNVISFTAVISLPEAHNVMQLEIPTGYLTHEFREYWRFNPVSGELQKPESLPLSEPWTFISNGLLPPILSTADGAFAMGAYTAEPILDYGILGFAVPELANRTNKWNMVMREEPAPPGTYTYQSFAIVGTLDEVQAAMIELYALHPTDFDPPTGFIDGANCNEIVGWAWDPKIRDQPIEVALYSIEEDGSEILLGQTTANIPREDLAEALGDNGEHGFRFITVNTLTNSDAHELRAYGVNSVEGLPDRMLEGWVPDLQCEGFGDETNSAEGQEEVAESTGLEETDFEPASDPPGGGMQLPCLGGLPAAALFITYRRRNRTRKD